MRSKNNEFKGYKKQHSHEEKNVIPRAYKVNGYYIIGEHEAELFKRHGYKVEEVEWQD